MQFKSCLILETRQFDYRRALSDLSSVDVKHHKDDPQKLVNGVRDWFVEIFKEKNVSSATSLWHDFNIFAADFNENRAAAGFEKRTAISCQSLNTSNRFKTR